MPTITSNTSDDSHGGTSVYADGERFIIITSSTGQAKIDYFIQIALANRDEICRIVAGATEKREWNRTHPSKARNWPEFIALDRMVNKLCREAGIKDS